MMTAATLSLLLLVQDSVGLRPGTATSGIQADDALKSRLDILLRARNYEQSEELLVRAIEGSAHPRDLLILLGRVFFLDAKPLNAAVALTKADALAPLNEDSRFLLAMAFSSMKRPDLARPELEKLAKAAPSAPLYTYWLGRLDYDAQQFEPAMESFRKTVELSPGFVRAWDHLGLASEALGKPEDAERYYKEAVRLNRRLTAPAHWPPFDYGSMLLTAGRTDDAEPLLREALAANPRFAPAQFKLGVLLERKGELKDAAAALEQAASLDSHYAEPLPALVRIYRKLGRGDDVLKAAAELERRRNANSQSHAQGR